MGEEGISMGERPSLVGAPEEPLQPLGWPQFTRSELELGFWGHSSSPECVPLEL